MLHARAQALTAHGEAPFFRPAGPHRQTPLADFDCVWMRKDPPFDIDYIFSTYILDLAGPDTLVLKLVAEAVATDPNCAAKGWLLDGFPRTAVQAETMAAMGLAPGDRVEGKAHVLALRAQAPGQLGHRLLRLRHLARVLARAADGHQRTRRCGGQRARGAT